MQQEHSTLEESWKYYREAFSRRSRSSPSWSVFVSLIDKICQLGYSEQLYAGTSLDNLVISLRPQPRDRRQTILVRVKDEAVEFRFYPTEGEAEVTTVDLTQAEATLEKLLPRLLANPKTWSSEAIGDGSRL